MEGHLMTWGVALGIMIDAVVIVWGCRAIARVMARSAQAGAARAACDLSVDDGDDAFDSSSDERYSHGLLTNSTTGLPMLDGVWMDVGGNPYGTDLATNFGSSLDGFGSSSLGAGFGGMRDG